MMTECKNCKKLKLILSIKRLKEKTECVGYTWEQDEKNKRLLKKYRKELHNLRKNK